MSAAVCFLLLMWSFSIYSGKCYFFESLFCAECGKKYPNKNVIDLSEPTKPGPFTGLTITELRILRQYLENDPNIKAAKPENATVVSSFIYSAELLVPPKEEVLNCLDKNGPQPERRARVTMFRGDKQPPIVEEWVCSPLPTIAKCELLNLTSRKNPVNFNYRPSTDKELEAAGFLIYLTDNEIAEILLESFGERFTNCTQGVNCLTLSKSPLGSGLTKDSSKRYTWLQAERFLPYFELHTLDFAVLVDTSGNNPYAWSVVQVWYGGRLFNGISEFKTAYNNGSVTKIRVPKPANDENLFSSMHRRGPPQPLKPQRPPTLVEPDGKRYSIKNDKVTYLDWTFSYHMSPTNGPALYDIRFKGQRIIYEVALSEIIVFYSGFMPFGNTANYVDSGTGMGISAKGLVPGADCPDTATFISSPFMSQRKSEPDSYKTSMCTFENNNAEPLRRHMSYTPQSGSFYNGMLNSYLVFRSALAVTNYDYIVDFNFYQTGVLEIQVLSAGYIVSVFYANTERPYGFQVFKNVLGNVHHHLFHFKLDIDIKGTHNRYTTLNLQPELRDATAFPGKPYSQVKINATLKTTEKQAILNYNFSEPKIHLIHNDKVNNALGESPAYRIYSKNFSPQLLERNEANEPTISWARHQMVCTKRKDDEISSSSPFGMFDSQEPTVDFSTFYADDENIVDEDLVCWLTLGTYHVPCAEDIPTTTTAALKLAFSIHPFNYFEQDPSIGSRDAIYIQHIDPRNTTLGVSVNRYGNSRDQCFLLKPTLEEDVAADPDRVLQSRIP